MILCLDIGNSHVFGGVFDGPELCLSFRRASQTGASSDELGLFFRGVLSENGIDPGSIEQVALCSVVPEAVYTISASCRKYFEQAPFILRAGVRTGLKIQYLNPHEVGSDRIANAIAAVRMYPDEDLLIIDLGTATTVCAVSSKREYLGGVILPGLRMSMQALHQGTAKLGSVEIVRAQTCLGRTTAGSIQSGLYFGQLGALQHITKQVSAEEFQTEPRIIATGGFAGLFSESGLYDQAVPDLVLRGLLAALEINTARPEE